MVSLSDSGLNESAFVHFLESPFENCCLDTWTSPGWRTRMRTKVVSFYLRICAVSMIG